MKMKTMTQSNTRRWSLRSDPGVLQSPTSFGKIETRFVERDQRVSVTMRDIDEGLFMDMIGLESVEIKLMEISMRINDLTNRERQEWNLKVRMEYSSEESVYKRRFRVNQMMIEHQRFLDDYGIEKPFDCLLVSKWGVLTLSGEMDPIAAAPLVDIARISELARSKWGNVSEVHDFENVMLHEANAYSTYLSREEQWKSLMGFVDNKKIEEAMRNDLEKMEKAGFKKLLKYQTTPSENNFVNLSNPSYIDMWLRDEKDAINFMLSMSEDPDGVFFEPMIKCIESCIKKVRNYNILEASLVKSILGFPGVVEGKCEDMVRVFQPKFLHVLTAFRRPIISGEVHIDFLF